MVLGGAYLPMYTFVWIEAESLGESWGCTLPAERSVGGRAYPLRCFYQLSETCTTTIATIPVILVN